MSKINNVSDVFREAKKYLWDGADKGVTSFICFAIGEFSYHPRLHQQAVEIIEDRLGDHETVTHYLRGELKVPKSELTPQNVQQFRKDWLTALEKEFAPKLKPKKGYAIHRIGDKNNNELSNQTYVKLQIFYRISLRFGILVYNNKTNFGYLKGESMNMFKTNAVSALMQGLIDKVVSPHWSEKAKAKSYTKMETASQEDIDLHNSQVSTRQVKRTKVRNDAKMGKI